MEAVRCKQSSRDDCSSSELRQWHRLGCVGISHGEQFEAKRPHLLAGTTARHVVCAAVFSLPGHRIRTSRRFHLDKNGSSHVDRQPFRLVGTGPQPGLQQAIARRRKQLKAFAHQCNFASKRRSSGPSGYHSWSGFGRVASAGPDFRSIKRTSPSTITANAVANTPICQ